MACRNGNHGTMYGTLQGSVVTFHTRSHFHHLSSHVPFSKVCPQCWTSEASWDSRSDRESDNNYTTRPHIFHVSESFPQSVLLVPRGFLTAVFNLLNMLFSELYQVHCQVNESNELLASKEHGSGLSSYSISYVELPALRRLGSGSQVQFELGTGAYKAALLQQSHWFWADNSERVRRFVCAEPEVSEVFR